MTQSPDTLRNGAPREEPTTPAEIARLIRGLRGDLVLFRVLLETATPASAELEELPRRGLTLVGAAKWFFLANGALEFATQVAAIFKPDLVGPLQALREAIRGEQ
jgi:hypothetical protein